MRAVTGPQPIARPRAGRRRQDRTPRGHWPLASLIVVIFALGLLIEGFARLGNEASVLHRDHRLPCEVLQQRNLLVGKRAHLGTVHLDRTKHCLITHQGYA